MIVTFKVGSLRWMRFVGQSFVLGFGVAFFAMCFAQPLSNKNATSNDAPVDIRKSLLLPAVQNLKLASVDDPGLLSWLDLLRLRSPMISDVGPAAFATMDNGLPIVQIDKMFVLKCLRAANLAGLLMVNPSEEMMFSVGKRYGAEMADAINKGQPPPPIGIDLNSLNLSPGERVGTEFMSLLALGAVTQWVILHEIGHHQLHHFDRDPKDLAESREWELAADTWAIRKMQDLGYSLDPLYHVMEVFQLEDEMKQLAGLAIPVENSTHPSWSQRVDNLKRFDVKKPASFGNFIEIVEVSSELSTGKYFANELLVPRRPMPGMLAQYQQFGRIIQMPAEFFDDGSIHLYGRTAAELNEVILSGLDKLYPDIKFRDTNISTGQISESHTRGYQADMAFMMNTPVKGFVSFNIRDVMLMDPIAEFKQSLLSVEDRTQVINRAIKIQQQLLLDLDALMLDYAKGTLDLQTAQKLSLSISTERADEMKVVLGNNRYKALQEKTLSNPNIAHALEKIIQMQ